MPSNAIDIYALLKEAQKEGVLYGKPTERELQDFYFTSLMNELCAPNHFWLLAKRSRGYIGLVHGIVIPGRWGHRMNFMAVDLVFMTKNRRKNGVGRSLLEELKKQAENVGIRRFEFLATEEQQAYWEKERKAQKIAVMMRVE